MIPSLITDLTWMVLVALVLTMVIEAAVAALFRVGLRGIAAVLLVNLVTNPATVLIVLAASSITWGAIWDGPWWVVLVCAIEAVVVWIESLLLRQLLPPRRALALAFAANLASGLLGSTLFTLDRLST